MLKEFERFEEAFKYELKLAKTDREHAKSFFRTYIRAVADEHYMDFGEAEFYVKKNFRIFSKYFGKRNEKMLSKLLDLEPPKKSARKPSATCL